MPLRAHGDAIGDGDGVELHKCAAGLSRMPCLTAAATSRRWKLQGPISVQVLGYADDGLVQFSLVEAHAAQVGAGGGAASPFGEGMEYFFGLISLLKSSDPSIGCRLRQADSWMICHRLVQSVVGCRARRVQ